MRNNRELSAAANAARAAGDAIMKRFGRESRAVEKSPREFVSRSDIESQNIIVDRLSRTFPSYGIVSEERKAAAPSGRPAWIVDPLDGTHNFLAGIPFFGVSIALLEDGICTLGAVYFPLEKKIFTARKGNGAFRNGKKIHVSSDPSLFKAVISYDNQFYLSGRAFQRYKRLVNAAFTTRILGCAARDLCFIAEGTLDARIFNNAKLCDIAAGAVILSEAGGRITDFRGGDFKPDMSALIASSGRIHAPLLKVLRGV
jgi:myo-inositol-1(or 4)-monophosphatase